VTGGFQADEFGVTSVQDPFAIALRLGGGQERVVCNFPLRKSGRNNQNIKCITTEVPPRFHPAPQR